MASNGRVQKIKLSLWDLFRWLHVESFQRRSLVPVRYTACAIKEVMCHLLVILNHSTVADKNKRLEIQIDEK